MTVARLLQYLKNGRELIGLLLFYFAALRAPFTTPALAVRVEEIPLLAPVGLDAAVHKGSGAASVAPVLLAASSRVSSSKSLLVVELQNTLTTQIESIDFKIKGVNSLADVAVSSTSSRLMEKKNDLARWRLDDLVAMFPSISSLPPKSQLRLLIWGDFVEGEMQRVDINSTAPSMRVDSLANVSPLGQFVGTNLGSLLVLAGCYFLVLALRRSRHPQPPTT